MAPNNALANPTKEKSKSGRTTILDAGTVESRGMGTIVNSREVISDQIQKFLHGEARLSPRAEFRGFFTVWTFVTRLPGPTWVDHHPGYLMRGMAYFPLSGMLIGIFVSVFHDLANITLGLNCIVSSVISELASLWVTGCFHEDGLADSADGIGGGWSRDQILKIMTDTRLGTYGCAVLLLYMLGKLQLLATLGVSAWSLGACTGAGPAIIITHTLARLTAPLLIRTNDYVDEQGPKFKFYSFMVEAKHLVTWHRVIFAMGTSFIVASLAYGTKMAAWLIFAVLIAVIFSGRYARYLLGGVMGDYLGATICVTEAYLLTLLVLMPQHANHLDLISDFVTLGKQMLMEGSLPFSDFVEIIKADDRKLALVKFIIVTIITILWCCNVGHPPVFVRTSVAKNQDKEIDGVRIALETNDDDNAQEEEGMIVLKQKLSDPNSDFSDRYNAAYSYLDSLAKPVGSLGTLEDWGCRLAALQRSSKPSVNNVCCIIFAADHGVAKDKSEGGASCSAYPQAVTEKVLTGLAHGVAGAAVLSRQNNVSLHVVDVGVASNVEPSNRNGVRVSSSLHQKIIGGTENFCTGPAMSKKEMENCMNVGRKEVHNQCSNGSGANLLVFGEIGIGNTTTSSALLSALTEESVEVLVGSGAAITRDGKNEAIVSRKMEIIQDALAHHGKICKNDVESILDILMKMGGAEIAAIVGGILEASDKDIPVLVDGFIVTTAAMIACQISPKVTRILMFATTSTELGQQIAIDKILQISKQFVPISLPALDMGLRMGEATGALIAVPLVQSAAAIFCELATLNTVLNLKPTEEDDDDDDDEAIC